MTHEELEDLRADAQRLADAAETLTDLIDGLDDEDGPTLGDLRDPLDEAEGAVLDLRERLS